MLYDAIVVGSGPGGSVAAATLASRGKSVLMVDRQAFPRDKVCGDGLPLSVMVLLQDLDIDIRQAGLEYQRITSLTITSPAGQSLTTHADPNEALFSMTSRRLSFDNMLHQNALKRGARFEVMYVQGPLLDPTGQRVVGVIERKGKTQIEHEAKIVIAADGASSAIARGLNTRIAEPQTTAIAIRAYGKLKRAMQSCVYFYFLKSLLPGYAWIFPMANGYANIGVYLDNATYRSGKQSLEELLTEFQGDLPPEFALDVDPTTRQTWPLPFWSAPQSRQAKGVLFVGDAGSFINAITGGGIYTAMVTGQLAAQHALALLDGTGQNSDYDAACQAAVAPSLRTAWRLQHYFVPSALLFNAVFAITNFPPIKETMLRALSGEHY
jgi:geranylgeranyl reductase family protein